MAKTWQRARSDEAIAERRTQILGAAKKCFLSAGYESTALNGIAREAGMAKANIYRYFETREEIFLALFLDEMRAWAKGFGKAMRGRGSIAKAVARTYVGNPKFMSLLVQISGAIEANVSERALVEFKRQIFPLIGEIAGFLRKRLASLSEKEASELLIQMTFLAIGAWPNIKPNKVRDRVLARPEFAAFKMDNETLLQEGIRKLIDSTIRVKDPK